jgi:hypothetical protein
VLFPDVDELGVLVVPHPNGYVDGLLGSIFSGDLDDVALTLLNLNTVLQPSALSP